MAAAAYKGNKLISAGVESRKTLPRYPNRDEYFPDETYYDENGTDERYHEDVHQYIDEYILPYMREIDPNTASFTDGQIEAMLKPAWVPSHTSKTVKLWLPSETRSGAGYAWAWYTRMREYPDFNEYFPTDVKIGVNIDTAGADKVKVFFFKDFESLQVYGEAREIELP
jgi:hypothetical protein